MPLDPKDIERRLTELEATVSTLSLRLGLTSDPSRLVTLTPSSPIAPSYTNKPQFSVHRNGVDQVGIADGVSTKVQWTTKTYDDPPTFDITTNYRWTPGRIGRVHLVARVGWFSGVDEMVIMIELRKNGNIHRQIRAGWSGTGGAQQGPLIACDITIDAVTDFFEVWAMYFDGLGGTRNIDGQAIQTYFMGHMIDVIS